MSRDLQLHTTELALRTAILIINTESTRRPSADAGLGYAQINYGRLFIRDRWTLFAIARELCCTVEDLIAPPEIRRGPRWADLVSSAESLLAELQNLSEHVRVVLALRACGTSWKSVLSHLPGRVLFSLVEDADSGLRTLGARRQTEISLLSSYEHPPPRRRRTRRQIRVSLPQPSAQPLAAVA